MKKVCSIVTALVMALTIFVVPNLGLAYAEEEDDVVAMEVTSLNAPNVSVNSTADSITFSWDAVEYATGYEWSETGEDGSWNDCESTRTKEYTGLDVGVEKTLYVRAYYSIEGVKTVFSEEVSKTGKTEPAVIPTPVAPAATKITKMAPGYTNIQIEWEPVTGADGYAYSRFSATVGDNKFRDNGTATSFNWTGLPQRAKKTFYVYSYVIVDKETPNAVRLNETEDKYVLFSAEVASATATTKSKERLVKQKYSRGYKYMYYDQNGVYRGDSYAMWNTIKNKKSKTKYLIALDTKRNNLVIYKGSKGKWKVYKHWVCACGQKGHRTPRGDFKIGKRKPKFNTGETEKMGVKRAKFTCWYATKFKGACFFHSTLYYLGSKSKHAAPYVGKHYSHGCVRLEIGNAKWLYKNCKKGTAVISRNYGNDCSYGNLYTYSNYLY